MSLSTWALTQFTESHDYLAQRLVDEGVFPEAVFLTEAVPIYDAIYSTDPEGHLTRRIAGLEAVGAEAGLTILRGSGHEEPRDYLFCLREDAVNGPCLMTVDCVTLETITENIFFSNPLDELVGEKNFCYLFSHGSCDYFGLDDQVYCYDGTWFQWVVCLEKPLEGFLPYPELFDRDSSVLSVQYSGTTWVIDGARATYVPALDGYTVFDAVEGVLLAYRDDAAATEIVRYTPSTGSLTVLTDQLGAVQVVTDGLYSAKGSLWRYTGGKLVRLAELEGVPILDAISDEKGGVYILTYNDASTPGILHVSASGAVTTALSPDCGHGLEITNLDGIRPDGSLQFRFYQMEPMGNHETTVCRYALEREGDRPAIRVLSLNYAFDAWYLLESGEERDAFYKARIERVQQELNDLGLGIA